MLDQKKAYAIINMIFNSIEAEDEDLASEIVEKLDEVCVTDEEKELSGLIRERLGYLTAAGLLLERSE